MRKIIFGGWTALFVKLCLLVLVAGGLSFSLFTLANFSDNVKRFSFYAKTADAEMTKKELISLHYFYNLSRRWRVQWLADKYLFRDALFYGVADFYLIGDWDRAMNDLKEELDDPRSYLYGNAKFRYVQFKLYRIGKTKEAVDLVLGEIHGDFEKALRVCLDSDVFYVECYNRVWNFDLTDNKKDAEEALKNPPPQVKYILGPPKRDGEPVLPPPVISSGSKEPGKNSDKGGTKKRP